MGTRQANYKAKSALSVRAFFRKRGYKSGQRSEAAVNRLPNASDLTTDELLSLQLVVTRSFMTASSLQPSHRARLLELGLIQKSMGGLMPTPAGKMAARL